jgi:hypothetical protein
MVMQLPLFVRIEHDAVARRAIVQIQDADVRQQREMWGMCLRYSLIVHVNK